MSRRAPMLQIREVAGGSEPILALEGELDLASAPSLRHAIGGCLDAGVTELTLDLARLEFVDTSGLSVLIDAFKRLASSGGSLTLASPSRAVLSVLRVTGLDDLFGLPAQPGEGIAAPAGRTRHLPVPAPADHRPGVAPKTSDQESES